MRAHNGDVFEHPSAARVLASVDEALSVAVTWSPRDELEAKERAAGIREPGEAAADELAEASEKLRVAVLVRHFVLFAEFLSAGVTQSDELETRCLIILRAAAPDVLLDVYDTTPREAMEREAALRRQWHKSNLARPASGVSLAGLLRGFFDDRECELAEAMGLEPVELRRQNLESFCRKISAHARTLAAFPQVVAAFLRRSKPDFLDGLGASQADLSRKNNEQRATVSAREIRVIEKPLLAAGVAGAHLLGGTKSDGHRDACAAAQRGNTNRADGEARKRGEWVEGDDDDDDEAALPPMTDEKRHSLTELRRAAEVRRLVQLFGPGVEGCDPAKTLPFKPGVVATPPPPGARPIKKIKAPAKAGNTKRDKQPTKKGTRKI